MSFLCDFPPYFKNKSFLEFDINSSLDFSSNSNTNSTLLNDPPKYANENEIKFNFSEQKNVQYIKKASTFELVLQISGTTILQDLIITAKAVNNNNNNKGDPTPIKCQWRRFKSETEKKNLKNINSLSYMPNAQDLGFLIEVEVESLDNQGDISIARYGPICIDRETEVIIEEMVNYEKRSFNLVSCNDKIKNKNFILELGKREIKLFSLDQKGKKNTLERTKYSLVNPSLELSHANVNKFKIAFAQFNNSNNESNNIINIKDSESNSNNSNNISLYTEVENSDIYSSDIKIKNEYEFFAQSKQTRELIYIIIQYNLLNIKLRSCKIFRAANYNIIPAEIKKGILKLIGDLKAQKEENVILQKNIKYLKYVNSQLNEECTTLEEDCKITMDKINGREPDLDQGLGGGSNGNFYKKSLNLKNLKINEDEWIYKLNELKKNYNSLLAKQKAINEEKTLLINKDKNNLKTIEKDEKNINDVKIKNDMIENEIKNNNKNLLILNNDIKKKKKRLDDTEKQLKLIQEQNKSLKNELKAENEKNNEKLKNEINEIKQKNENLNYENKNLIMQKEMLINQKNKIIEDIKTYNEERQNILTNKAKINKNKENELIEKIQKENESIQKEYEKIKDDYQFLIIENLNLKELYEREKKNQNQNQNKINMSSISNNTVYQISHDEYEEYENLRRNRDENEAIIMQLKSNGETLELEIKKLKDKMNKIKSQKKVKK